ncbi:MAG: ATP-binding protein [Mycobacteriaceae bacterium]
MRRVAGRLLDFLTIEPLRIRSILRLVLIVLIVLLIYQTRVSHWLEDVFTAVLVAYAIVSVAWLFYLPRTPVRWWFRYASTFVDVAVVTALCIASGRGTNALYPIFFLLPISVAFLDSPAITGALGLSASFGYLLAWAVYVISDQEIGDGIPALVYVQVGCLLWLTAAITALSYTLSRRRARVLALLDVRRRLIAESMRADERHSRELSEQLHDGPLQNLLAARLDLDELRDNPTREGFDRLDAALRESVGDLRNTVSTLHPQVLAQVGLSAAVRDLVQRYEQRWGTAISADIDEVGKPESEALIHRAARELLANVHKHSQATHIDVMLRREAGQTVLRVSDDGIGFDPEILARRVSEGHIGLASLVVAIESAGGSMDFEAEPLGGGSVVTVTVPDELLDDRV